LRPPTAVPRNDGSVSQTVPPHIGQRPGNKDVQTPYPHRPHRLAGSLANTSNVVPRPWVSDSAIERSLLDRSILQTRRPRREPGNRARGCRRPTLFERRPAAASSVPRRASGPALPLRPQASAEPRVRPHSATSAPLRSRPADQSGRRKSGP